MGWLKNTITSAAPREMAGKSNSDLRVLVTWMQAHFSDEKSLERLKPSFNDALPSPAEQNDWIAKQIVAAFSIPGTRRIYEIDGALEKMINARLRDPRRLAALIESPDNIHHRNETEALAIASRHAALAAGGMPAIQRIRLEAERLADLSDAEIERRLSSSPAIRLDPIPSDPPRRRQWLRDALTGEAAAISGGAMSPEKVAKASLLSLAPVRHNRPANGSPIRVCVSAWSVHTDPMRDLDIRASRMVAQSNDQLASRFGSIPGGTMPPRDPDTRLKWVRRALEAEIVRSLAGMTSTSPRPISIELQDIVIGSPGSGLCFGGVLVVDGERICRITSPGEGVINADQWSYGCGPDDIEALDHYIAVTGEPRDEDVSDSLAAVLIDQVSMNVALSAYRMASEKASFFYVEEANGPVIMTVSIPEGGSRHDACAAMKSAHPNATPLDHMSDEEAAMIWITITS